MRTFKMILVLSLLASAAIAQTESVSEVNRLIREYRSIKSIDNAGLAPDIQGSPYLTDQYLPSKVYFKDREKELSTKLRYNAYSNEFEFTLDNQRYVITNKTEIDSIEHLGHKFVYRTYVDQHGNDQEGFMARLVDGSCTLYKIYSIEFFEAEPPQSGYDEAKPARFEEENPVYSLQCKDDSHPKAIESFRRGKFLNRYGSLEKELKRYMRDQNIRLYREDDLVQFIRYYNRNY